MTFQAPERIRNAVKAFRFSWRCPSSKKRQSGREFGNVSWENVVVLYVRLRPVHQFYFLRIRPYHCRANSAFVFVASHSVSNTGSERADLVASEIVVERERKSDIAARRRGRSWSKCETFAVRRRLHSRSPVQRKSSITMNTPAASAVSASRDDTVRQWKTTMKLRQDADAPDFNEFCCIQR